MDYEDVSPEIITDEVSIFYDPPLRPSFAVAELDVSNSFFEVIVYRHFNTQIKTRLKLTSLFCHHTPHLLQLGENPNFNRHITHGSA
ncbi:hypothetical protein Cpar_1377 [Chlorobaculum parvum NCIB 8327]|uniref:Uncharacterized protein n=1 Tax=Chlorobaculum parvum (strain DSM 263 / NCIMB 8327) TaxID=517417 RepID=B3QPC5_CHLP8|nr:hypothetical protein [Chlorobaculum parvum]ACF11778.1 hypothetical protein Cpar_1377 [Chlorobaculum parvum NCIB 8327]